MRCCCSHSRFVLNSVVHAHDDSTHNFLPISAHYFQLWSIARIAFFHFIQNGIKSKIALLRESLLMFCCWRSRSDVVSIFCFGGQKHFCAILVYSTRTIGGRENVLNHFPLACMHLCVTLIWSSSFPLTTSVCWLTLLPFEALRIYRGQSHPYAVRASSGGTSWQLCNSYVALLFHAQKRLSFAFWMTSVARHFYGFLCSL